MSRSTRGLGRGLIWASLLGALIMASTPAAALERVFQIRSGYISGMVVDAEAGVRAFLGIPYAAPPTGDRRWAPPAPLQPWPALYEAIMPPPSCLQAPYPEGSFYASPLGETSEDCLYLNVWTAAEDASEKRPVMVWIHGGALTRGSGSSPVYDGTALARKGIVLVTINYRLGVFGYFAHPALSKESGSSGNQGVFDQIAALEWVRDNIQSFGGDPSRVTIFGESAGSWSVNALVATPKARGLIHGAIGESGGLFGDMAQLSRDEPGLPAAETVGLALAKGLGVDDSGAAGLASLRRLPADEVLAAANRPGGFRTRPNVDGVVFPTAVRTIFENGQQHDVPVIVGSNKDEGTSLGAASRGTERAPFEETARRRYGERADEYLSIYPADPDGGSRSAILAAYRDSAFTCQMRTWARLQDTVPASAWVYFFTRVPPRPDREAWGAYHAAEIAYVFDNLDQSALDWEAADRRLAAEMSDRWVHFATHGDPNPPGTLVWPAYALQSDRHLEFGDSIVAGTALSREACDFLDADARSKESSASATAGAGR